MGYQGLEMDKKLDTGKEPAKRRIDLSVAQVAGSAVAAVVAAVLASKLGVYGTVIGAGVVSVVATSGGTIFQHVFRRTGEQLREVTVHAKPKGRQVYVDEGTRVLRSVEVPTGLGEGQPPRSGEFTDGTVHGTRMRGWKRSALGAAVVFAVAMGGITTYELVSDTRVDGGTGTSIGGAVRGDGGGHKPNPPADQKQDQDQHPGSTGPDGGTPDPGRSPGTGTGSGTPDPGTEGTGGTGDGKQTPDPGTSSTPDPDTSKGSTSGGKTPPPTSAPDKTPGSGDGDTGRESAGQEAAEGAAQGAATGAEGPGAGRERQQAPPPAAGGTAAP